MREPKLRQIQEFVKVDETVKRLGRESTQLICLQNGREMGREGKKKKKKTVSEASAEEHGDWLGEANKSDGGLKVYAMVRSLEDQKCIIFHKNREEALNWTEQRHKCLELFQNRSI